MRRRYPPAEREGERGNARGCRDRDRMRGSGKEGDQRGSYEREGVRGAMRKGGWHMTNFSDQVHTVRIMYSVFR